MKDVAIPDPVEFVKITDEISSKYFKDDGRVEHVYVVFLDDGTTQAVMIGEGFKNDHTKDNVNHVLRLATRGCFGRKQVGGVLVTEGYIATLPRYARHLDMQEIGKLASEIGPPSKRPDRVEAILYMAEARTPEGVKCVIGNRPIIEPMRTLGDLNIMYQPMQPENKALGFRQIGFGILGD